MPLSSFLSLSLPIGKLGRYNVDYPLTAEAIRGKSREFCEQKKMERKGEKTRKRARKMRRTRLMRLRLVLAPVRVDVTYGDSSYLTPSCGTARLESGAR